MAENKINLLVSLKDQASGGLDSLKNKFGSFGKMLNMTALAVLAVGAALTKLTFDAAKTGDEFAKTSKMVGISAQTLHKFAFAAQIGGAEMRDISTSLRVISKRVNDANNGLTTSVRAFAQAGISVRKANGEFLNAEELLLASADAFKNLTNTTERTALAQELFGRAGTKMIPLLIEGTAAMKELMEETEELGLVFSEVESKQAEDFQDELLRMNSAFKGVALAIGKALMPIFTSFFTFIKNLVVPIIPVVSIMFKGLAFAINLVVLPLTQIILGIKKLIAWLKTLMNIQVEAQEGIVKTAEVTRGKLEETFAGLKEGMQAAHQDWFENSLAIAIEAGRQIHAVFMSTVDNVGVAFAAMITEGESFKDAMKKIWVTLKQEVVKQISIMIARMLVMFTLQKALGLFTGGAIVTETPAVGGGGGFGSAVLKKLGFAKGGIVQGGLKVPSFATGGITNAPQLALIGDNSNHREAVVPLPDGRSIPVDLNGGVQSIAQLNILPNANIDQALMEKPMSFWVDLAQEKILPALNTLGKSGATTSMEFQASR